MPSVWIDTDMGFDDLAAILTVTEQPDWTVDGISLVAGNAPLDVVVDSAARAARFFGWAMPIHAGRDRPLLGPLVTAQNVLGANAMRSIGRNLPDARAALAPETAVAALSTYLDQAREPVSILALGPLTNIGVVLLARPDLAKRVGSLVWMGGGVGVGNHTAAAEFNACVDPESAQVVFEAGVPLRMVGLDACRQVRVTLDDVAELRAIGGDRAEVLADLLGGYVAIGSAGAGAMWLYDPVAAAALVSPASVACRPAHVAVECGGTVSRGATVVEWRVPRRAVANAAVATTVNEVAVRETVLDALACAVRRES